MSMEMQKSEGITADLPDMFLICKILDTLPEEFFAFKSSWLLLSSKERTIERLTNQLDSHERALSSKGSENCGDALTLQGPSKTKRIPKYDKKKNKCHLWGEIGHRRQFEQRLSTVGFFVTVIVLVISTILVLVLICSCCRRNARQIISHLPPAPPGPLTRAPYPQQQVVVPYPVTSPYPAYPTHMPGMGPPYPHPAPTHTLHDPPAPTAPDLHALPPSYEQATGAGKQPPCNPAFPR
ncbi:hypothetical protein evm_013080 [Chilo suppressalis]|nr:hypothetical protein evm_013080 [Chilo suppressalis]